MRGAGAALILTTLTASCGLVAGLDDYGPGRGRGGAGGSPSGSTGGGGQGGSGGLGGGGSTPLPSCEEATSWTTAFWAATGKVEVEAMAMASSCRALIAVTGAEEIHPIDDGLPAGATLGARTLRLAQVGLDGTIEWVALLDSELASSLSLADATPLDDGSWLIAGSFAGRLELRAPEGATVVHDNSFGNDGFWLVLDPQGSFVSTQKLGTDGAQLLRGMARDADGRIALVGSTALTLEIAGELDIDLGTPIGDRTGFLVLLDDVFNVIDAHVIDDGLEGSLDTVMWHDGRILLNGSVGGSGSLTYGESGTQTATDVDGFAAFAGVDRAGDPVVTEEELLWIGGPGEQAFRHVAPGPDPGTIYVAHQWNDAYEMPATMGPTPSTWKPVGLARVDLVDGVVDWVHDFGGTAIIVVDNPRLHELAVMSDGTVIWTGMAVDNVDVDSEGGAEVTVTGPGTALLLAYDAMGQHLGTFTLESADAYERFLGVTVEKDRLMLAAGYTGTLDWDGPLPEVPAGSGQAVVIGSRTLADLGISTR